MFKNIWKNKKFPLVNILIQGKIFDNYKELLSKLSRLNDFIIKKNQSPKKLVKATFAVFDNEVYKPPLLQVGVCRSVPACPSSLLDEDLSFPLHLLNSRFII
jgi:hypothetical protein